MVGQIHEGGSKYNNNSFWRYIEMDNFINKKIKDMSLEEQRLFYQKKFERLNWIPLPNEQIVQANERYPPYWFITSRGRVISLLRDKPKILKPGFNRCGSRNKSGERYNPDWTHRFKPFLPVYSEEQVNSGKRITVRLGKLVAEHFSRVCDSPEYEGEPWDLHHCEAKKNFAPDQGAECNRAENLRWVRKPVHKGITKLQNKSFKQEQQDIARAIEGKPQLNVPSGTLESLTKVLQVLGIEPESAILQTYDQDGKTDFIDITNNINLLFNDPPSNEQPIKFNPDTGGVTICGVPGEIANWEKLSDDRKKEWREKFAYINYQCVKAQEQQEGGEKQ